MGAGHSSPRFTVEQNNLETGSSPKYSTPTMGEISRGGPSRLFLKVGSGRDWPSRSRDKKVGIKILTYPDFFCPIYMNF